MADRQFGPYRLVRQIAVGGMAEIHLAKTNGIAGFEKYVALKMIHMNFAADEQFIQMLIDEAKIAVQLNHANIAQTFDLGRVDDTYYITMEYVDGADLYKILRRGSEIDYEMPLDVCAFVAKEVASALDHAHRKHDHLGKPLGIVHRDVSPQNVLISFSGEVKLVDFGIAKATMKARQTAVGVIKGKYYYMSPEQAWGDQIDHRSDIFSAGIVLYEMLTGQMLYLEEDLHRLLDMARKAEIEPPSTLRAGIPPQLDRIVMTALEKDPDERYQTAQDFATDLERFLHTYSPVFTAAKVAAMIKQVVGVPAVPSDDLDEESVSGTQMLSTQDLVLDKHELQDDNSVIFRVADLKPKAPAAGAKRRPSAGGIPAGRITRQTDLEDLAHNPAAQPIPSLVPSGSAAHVRRKTTTPPAGSPRPRGANEITRAVDQPLPDGNTEDSGLLALDGPGPTVLERRKSAALTQTGEISAGESTVITGAPPPTGGFLMDHSIDIEATTISGGPPPADDTSEHDHDTADEEVGDDTDDVTDQHDQIPTVQRDFHKRKQAAKRGPPAALAGNIHAPVVGESRTPRASRRTPGDGVLAHGNVLQAIVGAAPSEPMPGERPALAPQPYANDASGLPLDTPPQGVPVAQPHPSQGYAPPGYRQRPSGPVPVSPGALYQPYGAPPSMPISYTGQLRLFEADDIAPQYKVSGVPRWLKAGLAGVIATSLAAAVTFFIIKTMRDAAPTVGSIRIDSVPHGAEVVYDGQRLADVTPLSITSVPIGTRHEIRVELARHKSHVETVDIPRNGGEVGVTANLAPITGKLTVIAQPDGAEIWIDGALQRDRAPTVITGIDMSAATRLELRLAGHEPYVMELSWPANGEIKINPRLQPLVP